MAAGGKTNEHSEELTFGQHLKMLRTQKGIDLKTISRETKIAVSTLRLMEEEAYDRLPDNVLVKGFIKAYAKVVDGPPDIIAQNFLAGRHHFEEVRRFEAGLSKSRGFYRSRLFLCATVLAALAFGIILSIKNRSLDPPSETNMPHVGGSPLSKVETPLPVAPQHPIKTSEPQNGYVLQINAVEETWLKIIVDRENPKKYSLNPGDELELNAASCFNLLIGSATGIKLQLDNRPVAIEGRHGQMVTLKLPE